MEIYCEKKQIYKWLNSIKKKGFIRIKDYIVIKKQTEQIIVLDAAQNIRMFYK